MRARLAIRVAQPAQSFALRAPIRLHEFDRVVHELADRAQVAAILEPVHAHLLADLREQSIAMLGGDRASVVRVRIGTARGDGVEQRAVARGLAGRPRHRGRDERGTGARRRAPRQIAHGRLLAPRARGDQQVLERRPERHLREALIGIVERQRARGVEHQPQLAAVHLEAPRLRVPVTRREDRRADQRAGRLEPAARQHLGQRPGLQRRQCAGDLSGERPRGSERVQRRRPADHDEEPTPVERDGGELGSAIPGPRLPIWVQHEPAACASPPGSVNRSFASACERIGSESSRPRCGLPRGHDTSRVPPHAPRDPIRDRRLAR